MQVASIGNNLALLGGSGPTTEPENGPSDSGTTDQVAENETAGGSTGNTVPSPADSSGTTAGTGGPAAENRVVSNGPTQIAPEAREPAITPDGARAEAFDTARAEAERVRDAILQQGLIDRVAKGPSDVLARLHDAARDGYGEATEATTPAASRETLRNGSSVPA